jgi:hypothetical protein
MYHMSKDLYTLGSFTIRNINGYAVLHQPDKNTKVFKFRRYKESSWVSSTLKQDNMIPEGLV